MGSPVRPSTRSLRAGSTGFSGGVIGKGAGVLAGAGVVLEGAGVVLATVTLGRGAGVPAGSGWAAWAMAPQRPPARIVVANRRLIIFPPNLIPGRTTGRVWNPNTWM